MQGICEELVDDVDGVLGCALVDLVTGLPMALDVKPESVLTEEAMMTLFAAAVSYFVESSVAPGGSQRSFGAGHLDSDVREVQTTTKSTFHFMSLVPGVEQELLVLVIDRNRSSLGLGWMALRRAMDKVQGLEAAPSAPPAAARATARFPQRSPETVAEPDFRSRSAAKHRTIWDRR